MVNFTSKTYQMKRERPAGSPPPVGFASFYRTITELRKILLFFAVAFLTAQSKSSLVTKFGNRITEIHLKSSLRA